MQPHQPITGQRLHALDRALGRQSIGMMVRVQQRHQRFEGANRRTVFILPDGGDDLGLANGQLDFRQCRRHDNVSEQRAHRREILGETGAHQRQDMARDGDRQRDAAAVEIFGDVRRGPRRRATVEHPRQEEDGTRRVHRIAHRPGPHRQADGHCRQGRRLLRDDDDAVGEDGSRRRQAGTDLARDGSELGTHHSADDPEQ